MGRHAASKMMHVFLVCGILVRWSCAEPAGKSKGVPQDGTDAVNLHGPLFLGSSGDRNSGRIHRILIESNQSDQCSCPKCAEAEVAEAAPMLPLFASLPVIIVLVMLSGLFSGLTLGLMGLDMVGLQIVAKGDNEMLAKCAQRIMPVRESGNQLLCTLLLGNVAVNSALSILTAEIASGLIGFLVSTALIVVFGEILPQAACSRYALQVGSFTVPIVRFLMAFFFILTRPMSLCLDCLLGREVSTIHSRAELMEMLKIQISMGAVDEATGDMAKQVAEGALSFRDKQVQEVMTPLEDAYMLSIETRLGYQEIREIFDTGFSRVPVYGKDKHDYKGLLYTKDLMLADPEDEMKLGDFIEIFSRKVETFWKTTRLVECLNSFKKGATHFGLVRQTNTDVDNAPTFNILGVLTLEDVMEEILQEEIVDETDVFVDVDNRVKVFGREKRQFDLGVFNPAWRTTQDRLSKEEVAAIAAHLSRAYFSEDSGMHLSLRALEWLVSSCEVQSRTRQTPLGVEVPLEKDWLYWYDQETQVCTLVLQGRLAVRVGREGFRSEAGSFSLVARDALRPKVNGREFRPDFGAFLATPKVRYLSMFRSTFREAQALDQNPAALEKALLTLREEMAGNVSRMEARELRQAKKVTHGSPGTAVHKPLPWMGNASSRESDESHRSDQRRLDLRRLSEGSAESRTEVDWTVAGSMQTMTDQRQPLSTPVVTL